MSDFRTAVLICQRFPYSQETGEVYLRTEIDALAAHSDKVIVLPCFSEGEVVPFRLPKNVIVRSVAAGVDGIVQRSEGIKAALRILTPGYKCMYLGESENFRERLFLESMYGLADKVRSNTGKVLENLGAISREIDVVYSYLRSLLILACSCLIGSLPMGTGDRLRSPVPMGMTYTKAIPMGTFSHSGPRS